MRNPSTRHEVPEPVEVTAHHMADAISFLMRVAAEAGLRNIVVKLAGVRASLLTANLRAANAEEPEGSGDAADESAGEEDLDERHKPH